MAISILPDYYGARASRLRESYTLEYEVRLKAGHIAKRRQFRKYGQPDRDTDIALEKSDDLFDSGIESLYYFYDQFDRALPKIWQHYIVAHRSGTLLIEGHPSKPEQLVCLRTLRQ
jgi:hypothetical protein